MSYKLEGHDVTKEHVDTAALDKHTASPRPHQPCLLHLYHSAPHQPPMVQICMETFSPWMQCQVRLFERFYEAEL